MTSSLFQKLFEVRDQRDVQSIIAFDHYFRLCLRHVALLPCFFNKMAVEVSDHPGFYSQDNGKLMETFRTTGKMENPLKTTLN